MTERPKIIAVTGTIGAGKSLIGEIVRQLGFPVIDTDQIVHQLMSSNKEMHDKIVARFGIEVIKEQSIDRARLGKIVFNNDKARKDLESIVHPAVRKECERQIESLNGRKLIFVLVPLLYETGLDKEYDQVWTVIADEPVLRERLKKRNNLNDVEIDQRLKAQLSQADKARNANHVIDNSGTINDTTAQVQELVEANLF